MSGKQGEWCRIGVNGGGLRGIHRVYVAWRMNFGWKTVCGRAYKLKGIKGNIFFLILFSFLGCFPFTVAHFMA